MVEQIIETPKSKKFIFTENIKNFLRKKNLIFSSKLELHFIHYNAEKYQEQFILSRRPQLFFTKYFMVVKNIGLDGKKAKYIQSIKFDEYQAHLQHRLLSVTKQRFRFSIKQNAVLFNVVYDLYTSIKNIHVIEIKTKDSHNLKYFSISSLIPIPAIETNLSGFELVKFLKNL